MNELLELLNKLHSRNISSNSSSSCLTSHSNNKLPTMSRKSPHANKTSISTSRSAIFCHFSFIFYLKNIFLFKKKVSNLNISKTTLFSSNRRIIIVIFILNKREKKLKNYQQQSADLTIFKILEKISLFPLHGVFFYIFLLLLISREIIAESRNVNFHT